MPSPIRVALIGCGGISRAHARGYAALGSEEVRIIETCDASADLAEARAKELGAERVSLDWKQTVGRTDIDAVDICLPHDMHAVVAIAAMECGKHAFVEKPLATTLADADAMVRAASAAGVRLMCAFCERFDPQHVETKRLLDQGAIGAPMLARIDHNQNVEMPVGHWIRQADRLGGGAIASAGCHRLDLLRWFLGEVSAVSSFRYFEPDRMEGEVAGIVNLRFESGAIGTFTINWMSRKQVWYERFWIEGAGGSIHNHDGLRVHRLDSASQEPQRIDLPTADAFTEEIRHFLGCIRDGEEPLTSGADARRTMAVALAAYESDRLGAVIDPRTLM